jgi:very-short-patch-repair endonuclease
MREQEWRSSPHAKPLRRRLTRAETIMWARLKGQKLSGQKFRRQHPIDDFIADFACVPARLIIEIDGSVHDSADAAERDASRTHKLMELGWRVLRFSNDDVLNRTDEVLNAIALRLPPPTGSAGHLPRKRGRSAQSEQE